MPISFAGVSANYLNVCIEFLNAKVPAKYSFIHSSKCHLILDVYQISSWN